MDNIENLIVSLSGTMSTPSNYGTFHLVSIAIMIILTIIVCNTLKNSSERTFRLFIFFVWIIILLLEIYKQLVYSFRNHSWDYQWYAFPFQLCSSQMYILPLVIFLKDGKLRDTCISFIASFSLLGGLAVYIYPTDVFTSLIGINVQTMIHHGLQIVIGVYFMVYFRKKLSFKFFLKGIVVFLILTLIAVALNLIIPNFINETFNMFYISPYFECTTIVLELFQTSVIPLNNFTISTFVSYVGFVSIYIIGITLGALIVYYIQYGFIKLFSK